MTRLERVSHVAQILAAAAVVASLLFVASQIRDNTKAVQRGNALSSLTLGHDWDAWLKDPHFAAVYDAGLRDYAGLLGPDKLQFDRYVGQGLNIWEFAYYSTDAGTMDRETWDAWDRFFGSQVAQASWRVLWPEFKYAYGQRFQLHVDRLLAGH
jgi:hypothetical protein